MTVYFLKMTETSIASSGYLDTLLRYSDEAIEPLLNKYGLQPRDESIIHAEGNGHIRGHEVYTWAEFMTHIINRFPGYIGSVCP